MRGITFKQCNKYRKFRRVEIRPLPFVFTVGISWTQVYIVGVLVPSPLAPSVVRSSLYYERLSSRWQEHSLYCGVWLKNIFTVLLVPFSIYSVARCVMMTPWEAIGEKIRLLQSKSFHVFIKMRIPIYPSGVFPTVIFSNTVIFN